MGTSAWNQQIDQCRGCCPLFNRNVPYDTRHTAISKYYVKAADVPLNNDVIALKNHDDESREE